MVAIFILRIIVLLRFAYFEVLTESRTNFQVKRFEICRTDTLIKVIGNITTEKDGQYLTFDAKIPIAIDQNIGGVVIIESLLTNKSVLPLFTVTEKNMCRATNKYLGEFWYAIMRAAQIPPGVCPISPGRYRAHHVYLNYQTISLQTFPFGRLRFTWNVINNRNPHTSLLWLIQEVINIPN